MVYYNGTLYVFNQDHPAGAWNENHVVSSSMSAQIELLPDQIIEYVGEQGYNKTYIQATDPALDADKHVTTGDYWIKKANAKMTWGDVKGSATRSANSEYTWNDYLAGKWADMYIGISEIYCRNASGQWIQVYNTDIVATAYTQIRQTQFEITQEAYRANAAEGELQSRIRQTADAITTEVSRATAAENSKIAKTSLYQDANSIVTAANNYTNGQLASYSTIEQTSEAIELYVTNNAYKRVSGIRIIDEGIVFDGSQYLKLNSGGFIDVNSGSRINIKSGALFTVQSGNFSIDGNGNVSMTGSITSKSGSIGGWTIANSWLTTGSGASCVTLVGGSQGSTSATDWNKVKDYAFYAGASWPADAPFWVKKDGSFYASSGTFTGTVNATSGSFTGTVNATSGSFTGTVNATSGSFTGTVNATSGSFTGAITSKSGSIGSWNIADSWLYTGSGSTCVTLVGGSKGDTSTTDWNLVKDYAMYAGASWPADAPFKIKKDGTVYLTKLIALDKNNNETEVNLRTAGLWKLSGHTVTNYTTADGYLSTMTLSNGDTVNFKSAASATLSAAWTSSGASRTYEATIDGTSRKISETLSGATGTGTNYYASFAINEFDNAHKAYGIVTSSPSGGGNVIFGFQVDASSEYSAGVTSGANGVTLSAAGWVGGANVVSASNGKSVRVNLPQITLSGGTIFSSHKTTVNASGGGASGPIASLEVDATSEYDAGVAAGEAKFTSHTGFLRGSDVVARAGGTVQTLTPINTNQKVTIAGTTYYAAGTALSVVVGAGTATTYYTSGNYITYYTKDT